jgi:tight adherence protein B
MKLRSSERGLNQTHSRQTQADSSKKDALQALVFFLIGFFVAFTIIGSTLLAAPFAIATAYLPFYFTQRKAERDRHQLANLWPELVDHLISGLRSGLSLAETLIQLGNRGPEESRPIFLECESILRNSGNFELVFAHIKNEFSDPLADQVCEVLDFARLSGSRDITTTLRTLGDHIRADIAIRSEIRAKHGWIKNSAVIATLAPWILLLILSAQPSTIQAFSTGAGVFVLVLGLVMSGVAFIWMGKAGKLELVPRIFGQIDDKAVGPFDSQQDLHNQSRDSAKGSARGSEKGSAMGKFSLGRSAK